MNTNPKVEFRVVPRAELAPAQKSEMFLLLCRHFAGVAPDQFARDLAEKNIVLLLRRGETLVGFSTMLSYSSLFEDETINIIYSGDTIVAPDAWGSTALPRAWVAGVEALRAAFPPGRCFWLLLTSGFRTYRFLPVFWREFFPRYGVSTPPGLQKLLLTLAIDRFGSQFDPATGLVRFHAPQKLRGPLGEVPSSRETDPHVAFFLARNPGWMNGDELVCLTELKPENLTRAGRRMMSIPEPYAPHRTAC